MTGGKKVKNKDIRDYARIRDVRLWEIANALGINDATFSRKLRIELSEDKKAEIYSIIDRLAAEQKAVR